MTLQLELNRHVCVFLQPNLLWEVLLLMKRTRLLISGAVHKGANTQELRFVTKTDGKVSNRSKLFAIFLRTMSKGNCSKKGEKQSLSRFFLLSGAHSSVFCQLPSELLREPLFGVPRKSENFQGKNLSSCITTHFQLCC